MALKEKGKGSVRKGILKNAAGSKSQKAKDKKEKKVPKDRKTHPVFAKAEAKKAEVEKVRKSKERAGAAKSSRGHGKKGKKADAIPKSKKAELSSKEKKKREEKSESRTGKKAHPEKKTKLSDQKKTTKERDSSKEKKAEVKEKTSEKGVREKEKERKVNADDETTAVEKAARDAGKGKDKEKHTDEKKAENVDGKKRRNSEEKKEKHRKKEKKEKKLKEERKTEEEEEMDVASEEIIPVKAAKKPVLALPAPSEASTSVGCSTPPSTHRFNSPTPSSTYERFEAEAAKKGIELEEYMMQVSQDSLTAAVEAKMASLVRQNQAKEDTEANDAKENTETSLVKANQAQDDTKEKGDEASEDEEEESEEEEEGKGDEGQGQVNEGQGSGSSSADETSSEVSSESSDEDNGAEEEAEEILETLMDDDDDHESQESEESEEEQDKEDTEGDETPAGRKVRFEEPVPKAASTPKAALALKDAVDKQEEIRKEYANANSVSHKKDWDKFSRQCVGSKFPVALAAHYLRDKQDLFRAWLSNNEDWSKTEVHFERRAEKKHTSHKEREGLKARDIHLKYPDRAKATALIDRLTKAGMFYHDPDFPNDKEEIYYYVNQGSKLMTDDITADSTTVRGVDKGNRELVEALTCEGGLLAVGALPAPDAATAEGQKNLLEAMAGSVAEAPKKKKKEPGTTTEEAVPKTFEEWILDTKMEECLKKSADGRKYAVALGSLEYSGDLSKELVTFSSKLETVFQKMQELRSQGNKDERVYSKFFQILDDKFSWYQKAEAAAKGLQQGLSAKPKKGKAKAKAKSEAKAPDAPAPAK